MYIYSNNIITVSVLQCTVSRNIMTLYLMQNFSELCRIVDSTKTNFDLDIGPDSITFRIFHRTLCR